MPRGPRSQSTPPSSSSSSSTFARGKVSALESLCSASANSTPILPSASDNRRLERVDEEESDGDGSHPPSSSSPSGTTTHSPTSLGSSSSEGPNLPPITSADKDAHHSLKSPSLQPNTSNVDPTAVSSTNSTVNPLYSVLRSGVNNDEPSVRSPGDNAPPPCPPVTVASSSPAGGNDTAVPRAPEPPARERSTHCRTHSRRESSVRGRSSRRRSPTEQHARDRSDPRSPGDAPPSNRRRMHSRSVSSRRSSPAWHRSRSGSRSRHDSHSQHSSERYSRRSHYTSRRSHHTSPREGDNHPRHEHERRTAPTDHGHVDRSPSPKDRGSSSQQHPVPSGSHRSRRSSSRSQRYRRSRSRSHHASSDRRRYRTRSRSASPHKRRPRSRSRSRGRSRRRGHSHSRSRRRSSSRRSRSHHRGVVLPDPKYQQASVPIAATVDVLPEVAAALRNGWGGHIAMGWFNLALALRAKWRSDGSDYRSAKNLYAFDLSRISSEDFTEIAKAMPLAVEAYLIPAKERAPGSGQALRMAEAIRKTFEMVISQRNFRDQFPTWREYTQDVLYEWYLHPRQCGSPFVLDPGRYRILWERSFRAPAVTPAPAASSSSSVAHFVPAVSQKFRSHSSRPRTLGYHPSAPSGGDDGCFLCAESSHTTRGHVLKPSDLLKRSSDNRNWVNKDGTVICNAFNRRVGCQRIHCKYRHFCGCCGSTAHGSQYHHP
ncbi:hypothetical protein F5880DRAFT_305435 [Lentinula raphanica]|nr:hypothetical protein F5880DRAFT_305435 [Lentinula raphanica]